MAFEATQQLYQREAALINARAQQQYNRYISDLARQYAIAQENLNANLEGRGIYRSGEASTARTRLAAENQAMRSAALQDLQYQRNINDINLMKQLASLQAQALPSPTGTPPSSGAPAKPASTGTNLWNPNTNANTFYFGQYKPFQTVNTKPQGSTATRPTAPRTQTADQMERNPRRVSFAGR